jgi:Protein of unknown function (DUF1826)
MSVVVLSNAVSAGNAEVLRAIREDDVSIAISERNAPASIAAIPLTDIKNVRFQSALGGLPLALERALDDAGFSSGIGRNMLVTDILMLANRFAAVMDVGKIEIRLEHVTTNACKKFHADYVTARLICTYIGQGTQWLDDPEASSDVVDCHCGGPHNIRQLATGDVALFKGRLWSAEAPAIHRSPPIEGTGEERLVLVINPAMTDRKF